MKPARDIVACGVRAGIWQAGVLLLLALAVAARAETQAAERLVPLGPPAPSARGAEPQKAVPNDSPERINISRSTGSASTSTSESGSPGTVFNPWRIIGALGLVLTAIFALRWAGRRFLGMPTTGASSGAIQVLCRSILSPKQQLMLVQVGRRIVLVADCGAQMNALCEISDPEEVASLTGQIQQRKSDSISSSFLSFLGRATTPYESHDATESQDQDSARPDAGEAAPEKALARTREELSGLLDRVRLISRHFRRA